jgi:PadR family transcriptional regulator, regulatory protein AphA
MTPSTIPALGYALLGLLQQKPASGYDLRKIFASTSMKTYSDSPGAIYPALGRLEKQRLIRGTIEDGVGMRRRRVFHATQMGLYELREWINRSVTRDDLVRGQQEIMLRFAFSEKAVAAATSLILLRSLEVAIQGHLAELNEEFDAIKAVLPLSARLAFECGIRATESFQQWNRDAIKAYVARQKTEQTQPAEQRDGQPAKREKQRKKE